MKVWPRSLRGRLLAISFAMTALSLIGAGFAIGGIMNRFVTGTIDQRLGDKLFALGSAVRRDGTIDPAAVQRFERVFATEEEWRIDAPGGVVGSMSGGGVPGVSSADDQTLPPGKGLRHPRPFNGTMPAIDAPEPFDTRDVDGVMMHGRSDVAPTDAGPAILAVAVPRFLIDRPVSDALRPLAASLAVLGLALAAGIVLQLRLGLRPLRRLRHDLVAVRAGQRRHLPTDQPAEIAPLAAELNALIDANEAQLAHARRHVANLAHGLKTPLAALGVALAQDGRDPDGGLGAMVARIDDRVRHHLGRARAAAPGGKRRDRILLAPALADLAAVLERIHADRPVLSAVAVAPALAVSIDPQDLDEMVGNLLDNAWRHARSTVSVDARDVGRMVELVIDDDGPGLDRAAMDEALLRSRRLDERHEGHGFGLPIAQELAELNGGGLALSRAPAGGLRATLTLPSATHADGRHRP